MKKNYLFHLIIFFFGTFAFGQHKVVYVKNTTELNTNIKEKNLAVSILYDQNDVQLWIGNGNAPSQEKILSAIQFFLNSNDIYPKIYIIEPEKMPLSERIRKEKMEYHNIETILGFSFTPMDYINDLEFGDANLNPNVHKNPIGAVGLISAVSVGDYEGSIHYYEPGTEIFVKVNNSPVELFDNFNSDLEKFSGSQEEFEAEIIYTLSIGKVKFEIPTDIKNSTIYVRLREQIEVIGKPEGFADKFKYKAMTAGNKSLAKRNKMRQSVCGKFDLTFEFYNSPSTDHSSIKEGYYLEYFDCRYNLSEKLDSLNMRDGELSEGRVLATYGKVGTQYVSSTRRYFDYHAQFPQNYWKSENQYAAGFKDPPIFRYYYLRSVKTGDVYISLYDTYSIVQDENGDELALKAFFEELSK